MTVACRNLLEYHVHSKRPGSLRFSKDEHPTMKTFKEIRFSNYYNEILVYFDLNQFISIFFLGEKVAE